MQVFGKIIMIILFIILAIYIIVSIVQIINRIKEKKQNEKRQFKPTKLQVETKNSTEERTDRIYTNNTTRSQKRIRQTEQKINGTINSIDTNNNNSINSSQKNK